MTRLVFPFRLEHDRWARATWNPAELEWFARVRYFRGIDASGRRND